MGKFMNSRGFYQTLSIVNELDQIISTRKQTRSNPTLVSLKHSKGFCTFLLPRLHPLLSPVQLSSFFSVMAVTKLYADTQKSWCHFRQRLPDGDTFHTASHKLTLGDRSSASSSGGMSLFLFTSCSHQEPNGNLFQGPNPSSLSLQHVFHSPLPSDSPFLRGPADDEDYSQTFIYHQGATLSARGVNAGSLGSWQGSET